MNFTSDPILNELAKPFHPSHIEWKPGNMKKDGTSALALAYADLRAYQNRLDEVCGMNWSCSYTPWGDKLVAHVTIGDVTRSSTGEPDSQSEKSEIAGTSTEAQAFKRACAMFGLGRYLYEFPSTWADCDPQTKKFTAQAKAKLDGIVVQHYNRAMKEAEKNNQKEAAQLKVVLPGSVVFKQIGSVNGHSGSGSAGSPTAEAGVDDKVAEEIQVGLAEKAEARKKLSDEFHWLGQELYAEQWGQICCHNVERITKGKTSASDDLNVAELTKLIDGMKGLKAKRSAVVANVPVSTEPAMAF